MISRPSTSILPFQGLSLSFSHTHNSLFLRCDSFIFNLNLKLFLLCLRSGEPAATNKKESPSSLPSGVQGLGMGLPDLRTKKKGKQKVSKDAHVSEALNKLREQTREAVKGLEFMSQPAVGDGDLGKDAMMEDWVKQFEDLAGSQVISFLLQTHRNLVRSTFGS